ncbi:MAG: hypothetical protein ACJ76V_01330 [Thermoleophilaceae bacterium]
MASPTSIDSTRQRDLEGRRSEPWVRRALLLLIAALLAVALAGVFGQRQHQSAKDTPAARLEVKGPTRLRGGLLYQDRFTVLAKQDLAKPRLVLNGEYFENLTLNTTEPQPSMELSRNGRVVLEYDSLTAGEKLVVWLQYQVNPTTVGSRTQTVELDDGDAPIATVSRTTTFFP